MYNFESTISYIYVEHGTSDLITIIKSLSLSKFNYILFISV
jgi:hypothetical protein